MPGLGLSEARPCPQDVAQVSQGTRLYLLQADGPRDPQGLLAVALRTRKVSLVPKGAANLAELRKRARFLKITVAGLRESHVHDVIITKEAPNYRLE